MLSRGSQRTICAGRKAFSLCPADVSGTIGPEQIADLRAANARNHWAGNQDGIAPDNSAPANVWLISPLEIVYTDWELPVHTQSDFSSDSPGIAVERGFVVDIAIERS